MSGKPFTSGRTERLDEVQVVVRGHCRTVPKIGGQQRQFGPDIGAYSVPAQQRIYGETVPKVMDPWRSSFRGDNTALLE
jgi:hypothetical protein